MEKLKKIGSVVLSVVLWAIIILAGVFAFTTLATRDTTKVANLFGWTPLTVQTDSMSPAFSAGDMIFIHTCDPDELQVGDVVTFHTIIENQYALNTHRIAQINAEDPRSFVTKGDNNLIEDSRLIYDSDIVGVYRGKLGGFGKVIDFLSSPVGFLLVIVLPLLVFFGYQIYNLILVSINLKKANAVEAAREAAEAGEAARADAEAAEKARAEAEAALAEAKRMKEEAEAALAAARAAAEEKPEA